MLPILIGAGVTAALGVYAGVVDRGRAATACIVLASMLLLSVAITGFRNVLAVGVATVVAFLVPLSWPLWTRVLASLGLMLVVMLFMISPSYLGRIAR